MKSIEIITERLRLKSLGSEYLQTVNAYAMDYENTKYMGTTHFIAHCDTENVASYRVMEKLGMIRTGEYGGRRNRSAAEDSFEYQYELRVRKNEEP